MLRLGRKSPAQSRTCWIVPRSCLFPSFAHPTSAGLVFRKRALSGRGFYLRAPRWGLLTRDECSLVFLRFGLLMMNVPLPT